MSAQNFIKQIMQHIVLARKYRPKTFDDFYWQQGIIDILKNAIKTDKMPHAIILHGIRGNGKTTMARILSMVLNCKDVKDSYNPCLKCDSCTKIMDKNLTDIMEIDAASHNGVDDIRGILESSAYSPVDVKYKVFIIDEVHMLSKSAFNALLKTLEEPKPYVKFILATTEIKKVPKTILSRCLRFDFKRIGNRELTSYLDQIANKEKILIENDALSLIARMSEGSVRDSLTLMEQVRHISYKKTISKSCIEKILGLADDKTAVEMYFNVLSGNLKSAVNIWGKLYEDGVCCKNFLSMFLKITHSILNYKSKFDVIDIDLGNLLKVIEKVDINTVISYWQIITDTLTEIETSINERDTVEVLLIKLCYLSANNDQKTEYDNGPEPKKKLLPKDFKSMIDMINDEEAVVKGYLKQTKVISYSPPYLSLRQYGNFLYKDFISDLKSILKNETGYDWQIIIETDNTADNDFKTDNIQKSETEKTTENKNDIKEAKTDLQQSFESAFGITKS